MFRILRFFILGILAFLLAAAPMYGQTPAAEKAPATAKASVSPDSSRIQTTADLVNAYSIEVRSAASFTGYAAQAEADSMPTLAKLFRAAAASKHASATEVARALDKKDIPAKSEAPAEVKTTRENLQAALTSELTFRDTTLAKSLDRAILDRNKAGETAITRAKAESSSLLKSLYSARQNFPRWKTIKKDFFVCPQCGNMVSIMPVKDCTVCGNPANKYQKIN